MVLANPEPVDPPADTDWHRRVVDRSLRTARQRSIDRGSALIRAAATLLERSDGDGFTVQEVADEAGQSLRTLYQFFESKDDLLLAVFEEAMRTYADLIRAAIEPLEDPLERLAGAVMAAAAMPRRSRSGLNQGLTHLRLKLSEVEPELVGRSQAPLTQLFDELVEAAAARGRIDPDDRASATFLLLSLNTAANTSLTLGNDVGTRQPEPAELARFCLQGLGASVKPAWLSSVESRLRLRAPRSKAAPR